MPTMEDRIATAYREACAEEIEALKPGNVHRFADGHRMNAQQFIESADVSAAPLCKTGQPLGRRVLDAVTATQASVATNTNLGIILLCAPLAMAAQNDSGKPLGVRLADTLQTLDGDDAANVFQAIALANPGGLGKADEHDVADTPTVSLIEAMETAKDRDMIARQYVTGFRDIFSGGLSAHADARHRGESGMWPAVFVYLHFLSSFPDSHIGRKWGAEMAEKIRLEADQIVKRLARTADEKARQTVLMDFDTRLKSNNINPGTSADLTVATLFANKLNLILHNAK